MCPLGCQIFSKVHKTTQIIATQFYEICSYDHFIHSIFSMVYFISVLIL